MASKKLLILCVLFITFLSTVYSSQHDLTTDPYEASLVAKDAYIFAYPMLENYRTMYGEAVDSGVFNRFNHVKTIFGPQSRTVVRPNNDTIYSTAWLDLRAEPIVISLPAVPDRYFSLQLVDMYTHNFAYAGSRTTGTGAVTVMVAGPYWDGEIPSGIDNAFYSEGNYVYCVVRAAVNSERPGDLQTILQMQQKYSLQPLSTYCGEPEPSPLEAEDFPIFDQTVADSVGFIGYFNFLLGQLKIHPSEEALIERYSEIGVGPDFVFNPTDLTEPVNEAIESAIAQARQEIYHPGTAIGSITNGWSLPGRIFGNRERMQGNYFIRATAAHMGLYGNDLEEAYYPSSFFDSDGEPLDASKYNYMITFSRDQLPPVDERGFWSITMYDADQFMVENPLDRYSIGDRSELVYGDDGSLVIYLQHKSPGESKESNWLPAPDGKFTTTLRIYIPLPEGLDPLYCPPAVRKAGAVE